MAIGDILYCTKSYNVLLFEGFYYIVVDIDTELHRITIVRSDKIYDCPLRIRINGEAYKNHFKRIGVDEY